MLKKGDSWRTVFGDLSLAEARRRRRKLKGFFGPDEKLMQ